MFKTYINLKVQKQKALRDYSREMYYLSYLELMTAYLRSQLASCQGSAVSTSVNDQFFFQTTAPIFNENSKKSNETGKSAIIAPNNLSQDKHKDKISKAKMYDLKKKHKIKS